MALGGITPMQKRTLAAQLRFWGPLKAWGLPVSPTRHAASAITPRTASSNRVFQTAQEWSRSQVIPYRMRHNGRIP